MRVILISPYPSIESFGIRTLSACLKTERHDVHASRGRSISPWTMALLTNRTLRWLGVSRALYNVLQGRITAG